MKIQGYTLREYWQLAAPLFALILIVMLLRLIVGFLHAPGWVVKVLSLNGASSLAAVIAILLMHVRKFGSYQHVFIVTFMLIVFREILIIAAILFTVLTGIDTIFAAPEFSLPKDDPHHIRHIVGHLTFGIGGGTLLGGAMSCLLLFLLRRIVPPRPVR